MSGTPLPGSSVLGTSAGVVDGTIDDGAETADSSPAHADTTKANAATANRLCRTKPSVTTPSPNRTAVPENHILNPVSPRDRHPTRPYRLRCQGVIATVERVCLMVSCRRGFVEAVC